VQEGVRLPLAAHSVEVVAVNRVLAGVVVPLLPNPQNVRSNLSSQRLASGSMRRTGVCRATRKLTTLRRADRNLVGSNPPNAIQ